MDIDTVDQGAKNLTRGVTSKCLPARQSSKLSEHAARESQILPFVRTRLTDLQRSQLMRALNSVHMLLDEQQCLGHASKDIMAGAALVACSLDTGRHVSRFLNEEVDLTIRDYGHALGYPWWTGLCQGDEGNLGWLLAASGPHLGAKSKTLRVPDSPREVDAGRVWLPVSLATADLVEGTRPQLSGLTERYRKAKAVAEANHKAKVDVKQQADESGGEPERATHLAARDLATQLVIRPFSRWCLQKHGFKIGLRFLSKIASDLAVRLANGELGDPAIGRIVTGKLTRETSATSHYTTVSRGRVARHYVETLSSLSAQTTFEFDALEKVPDPDLPLGAPEPERSLKPEDVLEELKKPLIPKKNSSLAELMEFHNTLTLRVWLMTSLSIGARTKAQALVNPDAIFPGNLVLINDKLPKTRIRQASATPDSRGADPGYTVNRESIIPTTRVVALPDHVADQIRVYGEHMDRLPSYFEQDSGAAGDIAEWMLGDRAQARWEPLFWVQDAGGKSSRFLRQSELSRGGAPQELIERVQQVRGNRWRRYLRGQFLGRLPNEIIDASLGHWQDAQGPWWEGAALDPVETWCRGRDVVEQVLPAKQWEVMALPAAHSGLDWLSSRNRHIIFPDRAVLSGSAEGDVLVTSRPAPLVDLFDARCFDRGQIAHALEREHLAWVDRLPVKVSPGAYRGFILMSAILWSGLLNPVTWGPWLNAVVNCARDGQHPLDSVTFTYCDENDTLRMQQTQYHDPLTARLCRVWLEDADRGCADSINAQNSIREWLNAGALAGKADLVLALLRDALELRARARLPGALVDFASGRYPSPAWADGPKMKGPDYNRLYHKRSLGDPFEAAKQVFGSSKKIEGTIALERARQMMIALHEEYSDSPVNRWQLWSIYRKGLQSVFSDELAEEGWEDGPCSLEWIIARLLLEMSTAPASRRGTRLYIGEQLEIGPLVRLTEKYCRLLKTTIPVPTDGQLHERQLWALELPDLFNILRGGEAPSPDVTADAETITHIVSGWIAKIPQIKGGDISTVARGLIRALCLLMRPDDRDTINEVVRQAISANPSFTKFEPDPRKLPTQSTYPLVTADQFARALTALGTIKGPHSVSIASQRRADICRICAVLMFRAGVRPYELSGLLLTDLTMRCNENNDVEFAELLITANAHLKRKTRLSRRVIPLDVLLEPDELKLLREWQSLRLVEVGGHSAETLLFGLSPADAVFQHRRLNANWILEPIARALIEARGGYDAHGYIVQTNDTYGGQSSGRRPLSADQYCYRLRHTAATCMVATLLLPNDATLSDAAKLPGLAPDLINHKRRERLAARLLGPGRSGRSAIHAVARILGHSDLVTIRATYLHLMDWSLGIACSRPALQPPLRCEMINFLNKAAGAGTEFSQAYLRKLAGRHHRRISSPSTMGSPRSMPLIMPQYLRAGKGRVRKSEQEFAVTNCGYLGLPAGAGFDAPNTAGRIRGGLFLHSVPDRQDVADLVIRSTKSGLSTAEIVGRFGIERDHVLRLVRNWREITQLEGLFRRRAVKGTDGTFVTRRTNSRIFRALSDANWNNLGSLPVQNAAHPFSGSFRDYSRALSTLNHPVKDQRSANLKTARAIRILLTRRDPYRGDYDLTYENRQEVLRYIDRFEELVSDRSRGAVSFSRKMGRVQIKLRKRELKSFNVKFNIWGVKIGDKQNKLIPESRSSDWAAYCLVLYAIYNNDDLLPFLQAMHLHWGGIRKLFRALDPKSLIQNYPL